MLRSRAARYEFTEYLTERRKGKPKVKCGEALLEHISHDDLVLFSQTAITKSTEITRGQGIKA